MSQASGCLDPVASAWIADWIGPYRSYCGQAKTMIRGSVMSSIA